MPWVPTGPAPVQRLDAELGAPREGRIQGSEKRPVKRPPPRLTGEFSEVLCRGVVRGLHAHMQRESTVRLVPGR